MCKYDEATASLDGLERVYGPFEAAARSVLNTDLKDELDGPTRERWYAIARGGAAAPASIAPWIEAIRAQRSVRGTLAAVAEGEREKVAMDRAPESWRRSKIVEDVKNSLELTLDIAKANGQIYFRLGLEARAKQAAADLQSARRLRDAIVAGRGRTLSSELRAQQTCR